MPTEIEGLTVKFGANTAEFDNSIDGINRALKILKQDFTRVSKDLKLDPNNIEKYNAKLKNLQQQLTLVQKRGEQYQSILDGLGERTRENAEQFDKWTAKVIQNNNQMSSLEQAIARLNSQINALSYAKFDRLGASIESAGKKIEDVGNKLMALSAAAGVGLGASVKSAIDFEDAFAGVAKTVDATDEQLAQLNEDIQKLAIELPGSAEDVAQVAENAGQLGIAVEDIKDFTETMIGLGTATNLTADDAATMIAQFANVTGMEGNYDRLGSALVALGNDGASTESQIMELAQRLSGAGATAGFSEQAILALGAAMANVGINAEAGGTSMSTFISKLEAAVATGGTDLESFASVAGLTAQQFADQWETEPVVAIESFLNGLGQIDENGGSAIVTLEDLGLTETRMRDMLLRLSNAQGQLSHALEVSNQGWDENTALQNEVDKRLETTASALDKIKDVFADIGRDIGLVFTPKIIKASEKIEKLGEWFSNLSNGSKEFIAVAMTIATALAPALVVFGKVSQMVGHTVAQFGAIKGAVSGLITGLNPVTLIIAAVAAAFAYMIATNEEFRASIMEIVDAFMNMLAPVFAMVQTLINTVLIPAFQAIMPIVETVFNGIVQIISAVLLPVMNTLTTYIQTYLVPIFNQFASILSTTVIPIINLLSSAIDWLVNSVIVPLWTWIAENLMPIFDSLASLIGEIVTPIFETFGGVLETVWGWISDLFKWIGDLWNRLKETEWLQTVVGIFEGLAKVVETVVGWVRDLIDLLGQAASAVGDFFGGIGDWFGGLFSSGGLGVNAELMASGGVGIRNMNVTTNVNINAQGQTWTQAQGRTFARQIADEVSYELARRIL